MDAPQRPAVVRYRDARFQVLEAGAYVLCAVTGGKIFMEDLKYWSVARQEAYADCTAATAAERERGK